MSAGYAIRVVRATKKPPYPVSVHLPPASGAPRDPDTLIRTSGQDLDLVIPNNDDGHMRLGRFMDVWSRLEQTIVFSLSWLLGTDLRRARLVMATLGAKQVIDLLNALALSKLADPKQSQLIALTERLGRLNSKRNVLVHGYWIVEAVVRFHKGTAVLVTQFIRETAPHDPQVAAKILDPKNQKARIKHCFTLKRIDAATGDVLALIDAFAAFSQAGTAPTAPTK